MAKIVLETFDSFKFKDGVGILLPDGKAVLFTNLDSRMGHDIAKGELPDSPIPYERQRGGVDRAMEAIKIALE